MSEEKRISNFNQVLEELEYYENSNLINKYNIQGEKGLRLVPDLDGFIKMMSRKQTRSDLNSDLTNNDIIAQNIYNYQKIVKEELNDVFCRISMQLRSLRGIIEPEQSAEDMFSEVDRANAAYSMHIIDKILESIIRTKKISLKSSTARQKKLSKKSSILGHETFVDLIEQCSDDCIVPTNHEYYEHEKYIFIEAAKRSKLMIKKLKQGDNSRNT